MEAAEVSDDRSARSQAKPHLKLLFASCCLRSYGPVQNEWDREINFVHYSQRHSNIKS